MYYRAQNSFSVAAIGCNFRCGFCQNWQISQVDEAESMSFEAEDTQPENIIERVEKITAKAYFIHTPNQLCYACGENLIERSRFDVIQLKLTNNPFPKCGIKIKGLWK